MSASDWMCVSSRESSRMSQLPTLLLTESWLLYFLFIFFVARRRRVNAEIIVPPSTTKKIIFWPMLMIVRGWLTLDRTIYFSRHTNYMSPSFHSPFISIHLQMKSKEYDEIVYPFLLVWPSFAPSLLTPFSWHFLKGNNENNYSTVLQEWNTMKTKGVMFSTCGEIVCRWW